MLTKDAGDSNLTLNPYYSENKANVSYRWNLDDTSAMMKAQLSIIKKRQGIRHGSEHRNSWLAQTFSGQFYNVFVRL